MHFSSTRQRNEGNISQSDVAPSLAQRRLMLSYRSRRSPRRSLCAWTFWSRYPQ